jgi:hypothetical protein
MGRAGSLEGGSLARRCRLLPFTTRPVSFCHRGAGVVEPIESLASSRFHKRAWRFGGSGPINENDTPGRLSLQISYYYRV